MVVVLRKGKKGVGIALGVAVAFVNGGRLKFMVVLLVTGLVTVTTNVFCEDPEEMLKVVVGVAVVLLKNGVVKLVKEVPRTATSAATVVMESRVVLGVTRLVTVANVVG
jgi:hypothetical protein